MFPKPSFYSVTLMNPGIGLLKTQHPRRIHLTFLSHNLLMDIGYFFPQETKSYSLRFNDLEVSPLWFDKIRFWGQPLVPPDLVHCLISGGDLTPLTEPGTAAPVLLLAALQPCYGGATVFSPSKPSLEE